jgi:hypothetical protein
VEGPRDGEEPFHPVTHLPPSLQASVIAPMRGTPARLKSRFTALRHTPSPAHFDRLDVHSTCYPLRPRGWARSLSEAPSAHSDPPQSCTERQTKSPPTQPENSHRLFGSPPTQSHYQHLHDYFQTRYPPPLPPPHPFILSRNSKQKESTRSIRRIQHLLSANTPDPSSIIDYSIEQSHSFHARRRRISITIAQRKSD